MSVSQPLPAERRNSRRYPYSKDADFRVDDTSHACQVMNISANGAALASRVKPEVGTSVYLILDEIEPLPGTVSRHLVDGFAVEFHLDPKREGDIADMLTYLADRRQFL